MTVAPPTGTASFFFTDVAGSTRLWEADPDYRLAGRLLGRAEAHGYGGPRQEELASYRETLDSVLGDSLEALVEEGAATGDDEAVEAFLEWADRQLNP